MQTSNNNTNAVFSSNTDVEKTQIRTCMHECLNYRNYTEETYLQLQRSDHTNIVIFYTWSIKSDSFSSQSKINCQTLRLLIARSSTNTWLYQNVIHFDKSITSPVTTETGDHSQVCGDQALGPTQTSTFSEMRNEYWQRDSGSTLKMGR